VKKLKEAEKRKQLHVDLIRLLKNNRE